MDLFDYTAAFLNNDDPILGDFCEHQALKMVTEITLLNAFSAFVALNAMSTFANAMQKVLVMRFKDNMQFDFLRFFHDLGIAVSASLFFYARMNYDENTLIVDTCDKFVELGDHEKGVVTTLYSLKNPYWSRFDFGLIVSVIVI
mmetsp:Transcript_30399/g.46562  ORF Transcript_30399/g.46562 Transcript_30399/m.46562 type:complete len:144 (+) Transcript_30399:461-892(+)